MAHTQQERRRALLVMSKVSTKALCRSAKLGRIIVGWRVVVVGPQTTRNGVVAIDPRTTWSDVAWDHSLAGMNDDMSRFVVIHSCGARRSTQGDQKTQNQNKTHGICSVATTLTPIMCARGGYGPSL